ncbi:MAG TPA: calcium/sodium antiporter [Phycisphaerales bacterium]|nr:calcium/sodium antiporter [Phycisphaerales bacterium]
MNLFWAVTLLVAGVAILWKCADVLVAGAVGLARKFGVSPVVIGLTIVAMGTSAPEVAASIAAGLRNMGETALGNVYGSNIANLALVGGLSAVLTPLTVARRTLCREIPVMLVVALLLWPLLQDLCISRLEAAGMLLVFGLLILITIRLAHAESRTAEISEEDRGRPLGRNVVFVLLGLAGLAVGADLALRGAVYIGARVGLSQAVIGLTIVAVGTSLPELATSFVAALRGHHDISIGNLVGSNIFNTLLVTGAAGVVRPLAIGSRLAGPDFWIMIAITVLFAVAAVIGRRVLTRPAGLILLLAYAAFMVYAVALTGAV